MDTQTTVHPHKRMFASLSCLALLAMAAAACDSDEIDTHTNAAEVVEAAEPEELAEPDIGLALVSETPDEIEGLRPVGFDEERGLYVYDRDNDGFPDITEALDGTDMFDPDNNPGFDSSDEPEEAFSDGGCYSGYIEAGKRLCISKWTQDARRYRGAVRRCRNRRGDVCSYEDLTYLYLTSSLDEDYNPKDKWIGNMPADDKVFCGNRSITFDGDPDIRNFEGTCNKDDKREYWCCHDRE